MGTSVYPYTYDLSATVTVSGSPVTIPYTELVDGTGKYSIDLTIGNLQLQATKVFLVDWANIGNFYSWLAYRAHPVLLGAYALGIAFEGYGTPTGQDTWEQAKFTVNYKNIAFDPTTFKEVKYSASSEIISLDSAGVQFDTSDTPVNMAVNESPQIPFPTIDCEITLHNQSAGVPSAADTLIGKINQAAFSPDTTRTWPADQVLFRGYDSTEKIMFGNSKTYENTYKFTYCIQDWRKRFDPKTGTYQKVKFKGGSNDILTEGDFSTLSIPS